MVPSSRLSPNPVWRSLLARRLRHPHMSQERSRARPFALPIGLPRRTTHCSCVRVSARPCGVQVWCCSAARRLAPAAQTECNSQLSKKARSGEFLIFRLKARSTPCRSSRPEGTSPSRDTDSCDEVLPHSLADRGANEVLYVCFRERTPQSCTRHILWSAASRPPLSGTTPVESSWRTQTIFEQGLAGALVIPPHALCKRFFSVFTLALTHSMCARLRDHRARSTDSSQGDQLVDAHRHRRCARLA